MRVHRGSAFPGMNPSIAFVTVQSLQDSLDPQIRPWRLGATMFGLFGALALLVAAIGLYSVISYLVTQRRHEIGVRIALGARRADVLGLVVGQAMRLTLLGILLGAVAALGSGRLIASLLFEVEPGDPSVLAGAALLVAAVALLAAALPALRAARTEPRAALSEG